MTPESFTLRDICRLLGVAKSYLIGQINGKRLKAKRFPAAQGGLQKRYRVSRDDLVAWMLNGGIEPQLIRSQLSPGGTLFLVATDPALKAALPRTRTTGIPTLFGLGLAVRTEAAWGAVVDLPAVGTELTVRALAEYSREADRPTLIGLYDDDGGTWTTVACAVFDVMLPRIMDPQRQAQAILRLRPGRA